MNIIITGAFGFVGTNLSQVLKYNSEDKLIALDISEAKKHCFDECYSWNDLESINWEKIDTIIHLAGKAHDTKSTTVEQIYFDVNVGLTKSIFEKFLHSNASKFIYFSSVKAVADIVKEDFLSEDVEPKPGTAYGRSKLEAERYLTVRLNEYTTERLLDRVTGRFEDDAKERTSDEAKKVYILRPSMIHGPGNKGNLNLLYKIVSKGIHWPLGAFENKRSFTSMANLQFVIRQIIEKDIIPGTYQIADDQSLSTNQLIKLIAQSQGKKAKIWNINKNAIYYVAKFGDLFHLPLNSERLKKLTESYVVSNSKLKKALGIDKMPVSAAEGMKKTLKSF
ncbi:MAG: NAD-dependent epimerase/dehydratase family protein [Prolixibacteraceae bacterium]